MTQRLRFYCRGTAQVTDPHAQDRGIRRCIGRRWQEAEKGRWAWVPTGDPQEVDYHADLVKACQDGDLWPADEETAKFCGVPFDPKFGGEKTESIKEARRRRQEEAAKLAAEKAAEEAKRLADEKKKAGSTGGKAEG